MSRIGHLSLTCLSVVALASVALAPGAVAEANLSGSAHGVSVTVRVQDTRIEGGGCADAGIDVQLRGNYSQAQINLEAQTAGSGTSVVANIMGYDSDNSIQDDLNICSEDMLPGIYTVTGDIEIDGASAPIGSSTFEVTSNNVKFRNTSAVVKGSNLKVSGIVKYLSLYGAAPAWGQVDISYRLPKSGGGYGKWQGLGSVGLNDNGSFTMTQVGGVKPGAQVKVVFQGTDDTKASTIFKSR